MSEYIKNLKTPIAVVGLGKSGDATLSLLALCGVDSSQVFTCDAKAANANFSEPETLISQINPRTIIVSPGVPLASSWVEKARASGAHITSDISLAASCIVSEKIVGVTGSVAKSTTVSILGAALEGFSKFYFVGGNLGTPFSVYAAEVLSQKRPRAEWVVLELSSYQLENSDLLKLDHSAITFLSPNHLERYIDLNHYYETKWKIADITTGSIFVNSNGGDNKSFVLGKNHKNSVFSSPEMKELEALALSEAELIGQHNQDNLALAALIAKACHWPDEAFLGMKRFKGLEHRLENCGIHGGIRYINDSKATSMDSVLTAALSVTSAYPQSQVHLLLGGKDKNLPWEQLEKLRNVSNLKFLFFGECRKTAQEKSQLLGDSFGTLEELLSHLDQYANEGDTVLLSPGGTSLDEFKSFEDRGRFFKDFLLR